MNAGAFSDGGVIEASKKLVPVYVDCDWGKKNRDLSTRYDVRGYPTVLFVDPDGNLLERLKSRSPGALATQIESVASRYPGK